MARDSARHNEQEHAHAGDRPSFAGGSIEDRSAARASDPFGLAALGTSAFCASGSLALPVYADSGPGRMLGRFWERLGRSPG